MSEPLEQQQDRESVDLKDPMLAAFLAWLIPGLGHFYQGRTAKAGLFFVCIMATFIFGLYLGSDTRSDVERGGDKNLGWGRVVYYSWRTGDKRLPYLCQVGVGLPALPALVQANRMKSGKRVFCGGLMAPPWMSSTLVEDHNQDQPNAHELCVQQQLGELRWWNEQLEVLQPDAHKLHIHEKLRRRDVQLGP